MAIDPLSPIAPARIRALLLPVGRIKRSRFLAFVELLQPEGVVRLGDISPDPRPDRNMFSPLAFPSGTLLYDLSTSLPPSSQLSLSPFEQFREPLLVIGIGDAGEYSWLQKSRAENGNHDISEPVEEEAQEIKNAIEDIREQFPRVYLHRLMMFECQSRERHQWLPEGTLLVPPVPQLKTTTMKTFMCDITATLLAEMTTLARSIQALPTLSSPASLPNGHSEGPPSWANPETLSSQFTRRSSQIPSGIRPGSPVTTAQKELNRMSMPVLPSASSGAVIAPEDPRATSPTTQGARTPPTTFDEISGVNIQGALQRTNSTSGKSNAASTRDSSADRVSIHGFGSGGVGERARNKGRGRVGIVIGTLYLFAGQWHEALRELTEGATRARAFSDHLWHAKALENILVCLLLFAWSGMDFQIPQICYPIADKSSGTKSPQHTPSSSMADVTTAVPPKPSSHEIALENLNSLIPDLVNMILNIYNRASNFAGEALPPLAFSECVIRFSKLMAVMNLSAGTLDDNALQHLVQNVPIRQKPRLSVPRVCVNPTRNDIATMLFRALPAQTEVAGMTPTDRVVVLAGIASVLSSLGLQRKKAIVMKEFITSLIPGLVQARKIGAAEMGVHPAAGLAALNMASGTNSGAGALHLGEGEVENGIDEFLGLLGRIYGIPNSKSFFTNPLTHSSTAPSGTGSSENTANQVVVQEILRTSSLRSFGSLNLKLDILRMCITFCEALPDFSGVLHFTALLLRMAGPGTAPKSNSTDVFVSLPREEQGRLFTNISRTVAAASKLGLQHIETDYWDDFLIRGLFIMEEAIPLKLTHHRPAELETGSSVKEGPFIHNPWLKQPDTSITETILVANNEYRFVIALQNPYDFELEVNSLRIAGEGVDFVAHEKLFILGPYRTQKFPIVGMARSAGLLNITGCFVKVKGCRERLFPIFPDPWKPERESKMKKIGLEACQGAPSSRPPSAVATSAELSALNPPRPETLTFTVIPDQPVVIVTDVSLPQAALMVLEGERRRFHITLQNTSQTTAVDFIHVSFQDSATSAIQASTTNKDLPTAELHELETQLAYFPSLRWCREVDEEAFVIKPGETASFEIEVIGRTRLTDAIIQFDYANLGKRRSAVQDRFFTRQLSVPISITVNASVQLQRPDIVPLSGDFAWSNAQNRSRATSIVSQVASPTPSPILLNKDDTHFQIFLRHTRIQGFGDEYCMLLLDLRNSWPNPLSISLQVRAIPTEEDQSDGSWSKAYTVNEVIQPGHVNRLVLVLPKIYLTDPYAAVPSLNPANQRQFVVSASTISPEAERASREAFWFRTELLKRIRGTWKEESNGRHGDIELRSIRFTPRMVEAMKLDDVMIETKIVPDSPGQGGEVRQIGQSKFEVCVDDFLTLRTKIHNRSLHPVSPLLRLQPHVAGLPHNIALDLDKRFSWTGVLQKKLPIIPAGQAVESELGIVALCGGTFEVGATVEEAELPTAESEDQGNRVRSNTANILQREILGEPKLRVWHIKEPCTIVAKR
ncbi:Trs120-domain-containing protein [Lindgomyces ingoldianus]|uniref:Trs120-domain-containing protein n=1 Tax=Lindgomyces ingoldianus TaxID=673940 RepID=A0ACB6QX22_9PLEO|nr:Trs120-domain-containing protein [Lindgomyces ingoldianus]KAF2471435.1 Trs120-domain-containing protein [Lindgomyces ingoldianus]